MTIACVPRLAWRNLAQQRGSRTKREQTLVWDWPLLLDLLGRNGLPTHVSCREDVSLLSDLDEAAIPHHALLDARLMSRAAKR